MTSRRGPAFAAAVGDWAAVSARVLRPPMAVTPPPAEPGPATLTGWSAALTARPPVEPVPAGDESGEAVRA
ncbi:hypothetical protein [Umezawaea sp. Da 62-37]|uniref:hypothetical protein n=1 Tax=Umezawaea sp. Da 62-37 TaxID=3075927 RepID=UPI0028F7080B|nr:hypothetical protein [Umezawaea sp. Da 62-37]WNV88543.1 hypothetical protein RM788_09660 [Umezawaea sp. Da 62-37]